MFCPGAAVALIVLVFSWHIEWALSCVGKVRRHIPWLVSGAILGNKTERNSKMALAASQFRWKVECMTEEESLEYLRQNQQRLALVMLRHCLILLRLNYGWSPERMLPDGKDPESLVEDVIRKYIEGDRIFSSQHSVEAQLKKGVQSWLSAIHQTKSAKSASYDALTEAYEDEPISSDEPSPADSAANAHDTKVLFGLLLESPAVKKSEDLQLLVMAIEDGADDTASQSKATDLPVERIRELRKKLKTVVPAILAEFNKQPIHLK